MLIGVRGPAQSGSSRTRACRTWRWCERRAQGPVQAVLEVQSPATDDVGEQVAEERRVLGEQGLEVELALGRDQLLEPDLGGATLAPLALAEPVVGVRLAVADAP